MSNLYSRSSTNGSSSNNIDDTSYVSQFMWQSAADNDLLLFDDMLGRPGPKKRTLQRAMSEVGKAGAGVIVLLVTPPNDPPSEGAEMDLRAYGVGAQILADLGVHEMILLTNAHRNLVALDGYGLNVVGEQAIPPENA